MLHEGGTFWIATLANLEYESPSAWSPTVGDFYYWRITKVRGLTFRLQDEHG